MPEEEGQDLGLLTEDEEEALKLTPPIDDEEEPETPPGEEKGETELSPEKKEEVKEPEQKPEEKKEEPPAIDGILARDGKNLIPYEVLETERAEKKRAVEEKTRLEAEIAELKKKSVEPQPKKEPEPPPKKEEPAFDVEAFAKEVAKKTYASEEDAVEAIKNLVVTIEKQVMEKANQTVVKAVSDATVEADFKREALRIKSTNLWITPGFVENAVTNRALALINERNVNDLAGFVKASEDAVAEAKVQFRVDEPKIDLKAETDKAVKAAVEQNTKDILAKFNIKEDPVKTLGSIKNLQPDVTSKFDEIEKLSGIDYEEAFSQLSPSEKEKFLERSK